MGKNSYSERILYDRYSLKDQTRELQVDDVVIATRKEEDPYTGEIKDARHVGTVKECVEKDFYDITLTYPEEKDQEDPVIRTVHRSQIEYVLELAYEDVCRRVAAGIILQEPENTTFEQEVFEAMNKLEFVPAGRILSGLGRSDEHDLTLFNCYVFAISEDSREGIGKHWLRLLNTYATGGGIGCNLSILRPRGSIVKKVNGRSSGVVSWAEQFSQVTGTVEQGGCFAAYEIIKTDKGSIGAEILANRLEAGEDIQAITHAGLKKITAVFRNGKQPVRRITAQNKNGRVDCDITNEHKVVSKKESLESIPALPGWFFVQAKDLKRDDEVAILTNKGELLSSVIIDNCEQKAEVEVFDFEVEDVHLISSGEGLYTSNSRRGAGLAGLWVWHPDIIEFIEAKSVFKSVTDRQGNNVEVCANLLSNLNVSILIDDEFMEAVEANADWDLVFPDTQFPDYDTTWDGDIWKWKKAGKPVKTYQTLKAREIWNLINQKAWESGEPGLLFMERANKLSNSYYFDRLSCTNPCVTGDTKVVIFQKENPDEPVEVGIKELVGKTDLKIWVDDREVSENSRSLNLFLSGKKLALDSAQKVVHTGVRPIWELVIESDPLDSSERVTKLLKLRLTEDHKIRTTKGMVEAKNLRYGTQVHLVGGKVGSVINCEFTGVEEDVYDVVNTSTHTFIANGIVCSNCGEIGLPPNGVCNLSHLNLSKFILEDAEEFPAKEVSFEEAVDKFNWKRLFEVIRIGVRFLDNCIDLNKYHDEKVRKQQMKERRVGLGIMGLGELFIRLGLAYGSKQGEKFTECLFKSISSGSYLASSELAKEKGSFPAFDAEKFVLSGFMKKHAPDVIESIKTHGIRNVTLNTIAPTGTVGTLVGTTTGIEPYFALKWTSTNRIGTADEEMSVISELGKKFGMDSDKWPDYVVTSQKGISPAQHVKTQAAAQRWIDQSISKTINLPNEATVDDVANAYQSMWRQGCKGGTVYRDGSRTEQVLHAEKESTISVVTIPSDHEIDEGLRPSLACGIGPTFSINTPMGSMHVTIRCEPETGEPYDLFINAGKGELGANAQAIARLISMILRWPNGKYVSQSTRLDMIRQQLNKIPGHSQTGFGPEAIISFPDSISQILYKYLQGDFTLSAMPFGIKPMEDMIEVLSQYDVPKEVLEKLFFLKNKKQTEALNPPPSSPANLSLVVAPLKKTVPITSSLHENMDICPHCGEIAFKKIMGACPKCTRCGYREC